MNFQFWGAAVATAVPTEELRQAQEEISTLKAEMKEAIEYLSSKVRALEEKEKRLDGGVAFFAYLPSDASFAPGATVVFNSVKLNEGGHYSTGTCNFVCPTDGIYFFTWDMMRENHLDYDREMATL